MTVWAILETIFLGPLKLIFEVIFEYANRFVNHPGIAIIFLSLIMNILVLPLYRRADALQEAVRDTEAKLHAGVAHIKKTFTGDERMMILQTYYRQNHYKPTDSLSGTVSLLLEIPFFMAAYQFLSHLEILNGVSFGPIADLGAPDGLLILGGVTINLLPILMTLINMVSSTIYLKGFPLKTKIQLYAMAFFFLVFLYSSPSCLAFYWTLNNLFSLIKNIFYKLKNPRKILRILTGATGLFLLLYSIFFYNTDAIEQQRLLAGIGLLLLLPLHLPYLKAKFPLSDKSAGAAPDRRVFLLGCVFLTVLIGLFIPTVFIAASPQEYVDITYFHHPLWYIARSCSYAAGTFLVWLQVFYGLASKNGKIIFDKLIYILCGVMLINYMFFGTQLGNLTPNLQYENGMSFSLQQQFINLLVILATAVLLYFCFRKWKPAAVTLLLVAVLALGGMSAQNLKTIQRSIAKLPPQEEVQNNTPHFRLSKTGKNVVVLMLDRAMGEYIPYLFNENPTLKEQFSGFTYYANTVSFGGYTNFGIPALLGGYEYTPVEMNRRNTESLVSKHNEALKVMPNLFSENGYEVTVFNPVYANYQWVPDLSIFDDSPDVNAYIVNSSNAGDNTRFEQLQEQIKQQIQTSIKNNHRNFFCFSIMKSMPLFLQPGLYDNGRYLQLSSHIAETTDSDSKLDESVVSETNNSEIPQAEESTVLETDNTMIPQAEENTVPQEENGIFPQAEENRIPQTEEAAVPQAAEATAPQAEGASASQVRNGLSISDGTDLSFMDPYLVLTSLPDMTTITEEDTNTYFFASNDLTHEPMLLQEPEYIPAQHVDNTSYDWDNAGRFMLNNRELKVYTEEQMIHYQTNMAAMLQLGEWFDYLRENDVYDNTRIILVADHGRPLEQLDDLILDDGSDLLKDLEFYYPLLMVKDFGSNEFTTSDAFMTNADVPTLATKDLIENPINPFTGKGINNEEKFSHEQFVIQSYDWDVAINNGNTYLPAKWASVKDNLWDKNNWTLFDQMMVLDENQAPW